MPRALDRAPSQEHVDRNRQSGGERQRRGAHRRRELRQVRPQHCANTPCAAARRSASAIMLGLRSIPVTRAPREASSRLQRPTPQPMSSTLVPGRTRSHISRPDADSNESRGCRTRAFRTSIRPRARRPRLQSDVRARPSRQGVSTTPEPFPQSSPRPRPPHARRQPHPRLQGFHAVATAGTAAALFCCGSLAVNSLHTSCSSAIGSPCAAIVRKLHRIQSSERTRDGKCAARG